MISQFVSKTERIFCRLCGKLVYHADRVCSIMHDDPIIMLLIILILVFVSRMLVRILWPRCPVWAGHVFTIFTFTIAGGAALSSTDFPTAECASGNEPAADASGSGTEALELERAALEEKFREFLLLYSGGRAPQQRVFDNLKSELKLGSATQADLAKMAKIIEHLRNSRFPSPREAASQIVMDYSDYYQTKYKKSLFSIWLCNLFFFFQDFEDPTPLLV
jgi:hypothetical protein